MVPNAKQALQIVRIFKISLIVAALLCLYVAFKTPPKRNAPPDPETELIIVVIALTNVAGGLILPGLIERNARRNQPNTPATRTPIQRWMSGYVLSMALFLSCVLFGFVLHTLGARVLVTNALFAAGLIAMLFWGPGTPPIDGDTSSSQISSEP
jgi:heme/copper-type cytochrome/quinol oxidase subunit 1